MLSNIIMLTEIHHHHQNSFSFFQFFFCSTKNNYCTFIMVLIINICISVRAFLTNVLPLSLVEQTDHYKSED